MSKSIHPARRVVLAFMGLSILGSGLARAADYAYDAASGDWRASPINWVDTENGYFVYPDAFDDVGIGTNYPANFFGLTSSVTLTTAESVRSLFLGRGPNASGTLTLQPGSSLLTQFLYLGTQLTSSTGVIHRNGGALNVDSVSLANGSVLNLRPGDTIGQLDFLSGSPTVSLVQPAGSLTGFTLTRNTLDSLRFATAAGKLILAFDGVPSSGLDWVFRQANPVGGDWVSRIDALIASGNIVVTGGAYGVFSHPNGFTYVALPEPATTWPAVMLASIALARRRRTPRTIRCRPGDECRGLANNT